MRRWSWRRSRPTVPVPVGLWATALCSWLVLLAAAPAAAAGRIAVIVGNNAGDSDEVRLRYAEEDATKVHRVLRDLGGFAPEDMVVLRNEDTTAVRHAIIRVNERLRSEGATDTMLVVYYSGHADALALHLGGSHFPIDELEGLVRGSSARMRVLIVDACRSGALTRVKGSVPAPPFDIRVRRSDANEGAVFLTSTAANEDAQESDELRGSFFTHYLVSGLLGAADTDRNRRVTLNEAYAYTYEGTLRASSRSMGGTQHPTFSYELRGHEDVVLTTLGTQGGRPMGALTLPAGRGYLVMQDGPEGRVIAETTPGAAPHGLTLPPGRYFLRGRGRDDLIEGTVTLPADGELAVRERDLARVAYARLVRKGGGVLERIRGVHVGYLVRSGLWPGSDPCQGAFAAYEVVTHGLSWTARASACRAGFQNDTLVATADDLNVQIEGAHVWDLPLVSLHVGLALGPSWLRQSFTTRGEARARLALAGTLAASTGVEVPLWRGVVLNAAMAASGYIFKENDPQQGDRWTTPVTFMARLGLGLRW